MAGIRRFEYEISTNYIRPASIVRGGVQGEHNATEVDFKLTDELINALKNLAVENKKICYRFDGIDGTGQRHNYEPYELNTENKNYYFPIGIELTRYGGIVRVIFVITVYDETKDIFTDLEAYSYEAKFSLDFSSNVVEMAGDGYESLSTLAMVAKNSAQILESCTTEAVNAANRTETAKAVLEGGTVWVFDGGGAGCEAGIKVVVDSAINELSTNPVQNKVVKAYVDNKIEAAKEEFHLPPVYIVASGEINSPEVAEDEANGTPALSAGTWHYKVFSDKTVEMWTASVSFIGKINTSTTLGYVSSVPFSMVKFPFELKNSKDTFDNEYIPHSISVSLAYVSYGNVSYINCGNAKDKIWHTHTPKMLACATGNLNANVNITARVEVKGTLTDEEYKKIANTSAEVTEDAGS